MVNFIFQYNRYCRLISDQIIFIKFDPFVLMKTEQIKKKPLLFESVNLPAKRNLHPATQCIFEKADINSEESKLISPKLKQRRDEFINQIEDQLTVFEDTAYNFKFPESKFEQVAEGKKNNISYELKIQIEEQDTFANRLTDLQLKQIKQRGEFQVRSKSEKATIPYTWKINGCLFRGRIKRVLAWQEGLARVYQMMDQAIDLFIETVPYNLGKLINLPVKLFALIFGRKRLRLFYTPDHHRQVFKDFWTDIMQNQLKDLKDEIGHEFLQLLYLPYEAAIYEQGNVHNTEQQAVRKKKIEQYNEKKKKIDGLKAVLRGLEATFQYNWSKIRKNVLTKVSNQIQQRSITYLMAENDSHPLNEEDTKKRDESIMRRFHEEKYLIYTAHVKQNIAKQNMSKQVVQSLTALMTIVGLIEAKIKAKNIRLRQTQSGIRENITKKHPIRSNYYKFVDNNVNKLYKPLQQQIENQFYDQLMNDPQINSRLTQKYLTIYQKYIRLRKNFNTLVEQKKQTMKCLYEPQRVFRTTYILFPPYELLRNNGYYYLKRKQQLRTDTSHHFWKCSLYAMRLQSWSINCFKFMVGMCWASPLGLRCLFGIANFAYDETCDPNTGAKSEITRTPFLGRFCKVLRGIGKSRNAFQALPDRGLFGKNCSRICNYLECYVFRFFFVGVIGVLMLYPVAIIAFSCICFVGILTFWLWVPICMIICYLFNILVFQFQISFQPSGCLIRSIPLLSLVFLILLYVLKIVGAILLLFVLAPLGCILYFLYLILQRLLRTFTDTIMLCLMGCLGRTPSRDTSIAKKVSGPGMSRNYFYSIAEQDVYILTQCALEKLQVTKFAQLTRAEIQKNNQKYNAVCNFSLKPFGYQRPTLKADRNYIQANTNHLMNHFNKKVSNYMARYPNNPRNVRFTREEIQLYFENCVKIVKSFVEKQKIQDWVFDQFHILYEDYDELTRRLWTQIFNCGQQIFEPIEKIDNRFQLLDEDSDDEDGQTKKYKGSIMKALQGQIQLTRQKVNFSPARKSLLAKDEQICNISTILGIHDSNHATYINISLQNPMVIFIPHRNLNDLKAYDNHQRQMIVVNKPKVIEQ